MAPDGRHEIDINQKKKVCNEQIEIFAGLCSLHALESEFSKKKKKPHRLSIYSFYDHTRFAVF